MVGDLFLGPSGTPQQPRHLGHPGLLDETRRRAARLGGKDAGEMSRIDLHLLGQRFDR